MTVRPGGALQAPIRRSTAAKSRVAWDVIMQDANMGKIADLESRIAKQRRIIEGFQSLCHATPNQDVIRQAESNIRSAQHTISFLEESLAQLQRRGSLSETVSALSLIHI